MEIIQSEKWHVTYLAPRLRQQDVAEIRAGSGSKPEEALMEGLQLSMPHACTLISPLTKLPCAMCGVTPFGEGIGLVWLLGTPELAHSPLAFQKAARKLIEKAFTELGYTEIGNVVHAGNTTAVRWLRHMGFTFTQENVPAGRNGELFHAFTTRREGQAQHGEGYNSV